MVLDIYKKCAAVLAKKPVKLWGITLLEVLLSGVAGVLFGPVVAASAAAGILLDTAMLAIFLKSLRGEESSVENLFDCFRSWDTVKRVLGGMGWMILWIFIWSLIPVAGIVFGVIRSYEYRFTPFILLNEPDVPIKEAIKVSKERTQGYKGKMFAADILWIALFIAAAIILALMGGVRIIGWVFILALLVLIIAVILLSPLFVGLVRTTFYVETEKKRPGGAFYEEPKTKISEPEKTCPNCGAPVRKEDSFCSNCGTKIEE